MVRGGIGAIVAATTVAIGLSNGDIAQAKSGKCKPKCGECEKCDKGDCKKKNGKKVCEKGKCKPLTGARCSVGTCQNGKCVAPAGGGGQVVCPGKVQCEGGCCDQCCLPLAVEGGFQCATAADQCCSVENGGSYCSPPQTKCCPITVQEPFGSCCRPSQACCAVDGNCDPGFSCHFGCCTPPPLPCTGGGSGTPCGPSGSCFCVFTADPGGATFCVGGWDCDTTCDDSTDCGQGEVCVISDTCGNQTGNCFLDAPAKGVMPDR